MPFPAGFVLKNGLKIFPLTSGGMPAPLSRMLISTPSPRLFVEAANVGSKRSYWPVIYALSPRRIRSK